ncbi:aspartate-rich protein 1 isoform X1 [Pongo abelii]|uniref:aspartate-rich protein 1 isoform X1 n=1 Tax=Pongo abelii TaxID=9601 RepID=UPI003004177B
MGNILTCCINSNCGWCRGKEAPCYESDIYEAVAVATSESTTVEPGKLDEGATEGQDLQHISNQKTPTGPPEDRLSLKFLPPSEEDDDAKILPSPVQGSSEDNLNLVCPPRSEDYDGDDIEAQLLQLPVLGGCYQFDSSCCSSEDKLSLVCLPPSDVDDLDDDVAEAQILPSPVQAWPEDRLFLRCSPQCKDEEDDDDDLDAHITAQKENDLTLESLSDEEIHPVETRSKDGPFLRCSPRCKDEEDDDDDLDAHITAQKENDLTLESLSDEEIPPVETRSKDGPFLRCSPRCKDEEDDDDDLDAHITAQKENDLTLESLSDEEIHPG